MKKNAKKTTGRANTATKPRAAKATARRKQSAIATPGATTHVNQWSIAARQSKKDIVLALVRRPDGATLAELMTATGWQAHSVRGFISGTLRKALGLTVQLTKHNDGSSVYMVAQPKREDAPGR